MGGIFINYRRSEQHRGTVRAVRDRLAEHFGADQVFLDVESISPGRRYPDELRKRLADAEVLLAVIHEGWAAERDEDGVRRLFREDDWVRMEIETALRTGKAVIPVVLAGAEPPSADELPENLSEFALKNAHFLSSLASDMWVPGREALVALLERDHVAPLWEIYQPSKPDRSTVSGCWLTVRTILAAVVVTGLAWAVAGDPRSEPWLAPVSIGAMSFGLLLVFTLCVPLRGVFNRFEHWLHGVSERTYLLLTSGPLIVLFLLGLAIAVRLWTGEVEPGAVLFAVVFAFVLFWMAMRIVQADAREREQWNRWPTKLPRRVPRRLLRRTVARLEERVAAWTSRLTREQRGKASVELEEIEHALYRLRGDGTVPAALADRGHAGALQRVRGVDRSEHSAGPRLASRRGDRAWAGRDADEPTRRVGHCGDALPTSALAPAGGVRGDRAAEGRTCGYGRGTELPCPH